jgi:hypothetical protein
MRRGFGLTALAHRLRPGGLGMLAAAAAGAGIGASVAALAVRTDQVRAGTTISFAACGVAPLSELPEVPLAPFRTGAGDVPLSIGPVALSVSGPSVTLRFREVPDTAAKRATSEGATIVLPILAGGAPLPDEITLKCRYDRLAGALYRYDEEIVEVATAP